MKRMAAALIVICGSLPARPAIAVAGDVATTTGARAPVPGEVATIAVGPSNALVVWTDLRPGQEFLNAGTDIAAARTTHEGRLIDTRAFTVAAGARFESLPAVAYGGGVYAVTWVARTGYEDEAGSVQVRLVRADDRSFVGAASVLPTHDAVRGGPSVAFDGAGTFAVVWAEWTGSASRIVLARVSSTGALLGRHVVADANVERHDPSVAWTGSAFYAVWSDRRNAGSGGPLQYDVYGARITHAGAVLDPAGVPVSRALRDQTSPRIAGNGAGALILWTDLRYGSSTGRDVFGARLSRGNRVLDPAGIPLVRASSQQTAPHVAWNGARYIVTYTHAFASIRRVLVTTGASVAAPRTVCAWAPGCDAADVGSHAGRALLVWESRLVAASALDAAGVPRNPTGFVIPFGASSQTGPGSATGGNLTLVAWVDSRGGRTGSEIYAARIDGSGGVLDRAGIRISAASGAEERPVSVAWNGSRFLVVWDTASDVFAATVTPLGAVSEPVLVSRSGHRNFQPAVASDGARFLVAWTSCASDMECFDGSARRIVAARVSDAGALIDLTPKTVVDTGAYVGDAALSWNGASYLAVWADRRNHPTRGDDIRHDLFGGRLTATAARRDGNGVLISGGDGDARAPVIAWDGERHLVAWSHGPFGPDADAEVRLRRVSGTMSILDDADIVVASDAHRAGLAIAPRASGGAVVAWTQDDQDETPADQTAGIAAARIGGDGVVVDPGGDAQVVTPGRDGGPVLSGPWLVYERYEAGSVRARRVFARPLIFS